MLLFYFTTTLFVLVQPVEELRCEVAENNGSACHVSIATIPGSEEEEETYPHEGSFL
jgi:hypothetical protein